MKAHFNKQLFPLLLLSLTSAHADTFGSGIYQFEMDFVDIRNAGNPDDVDNPFDRDGSGDAGTPFGGVNHTTRQKFKKS